MASCEPDYPRGRAWLIALVPATMSASFDFRVAPDVDLKVPPPPGLEEGAWILSPVLGVSSPPFS